MAARAPASWLNDVLAAERAGELLSAVDLAERGLEEHPGDVALQHRAVLALARAGSTEQAARQFGEYGLGAVDTEDVRALEARIAKDVALAAAGERRRRLALRSAALYSEIFDSTGGYYPAINAATMQLVGGNAGGARALARQALASLRASGDENYFAAATDAEALLLLGDADGARLALERAASLHGADYGAVATTRRQLRLVCECAGIDGGILSLLAGPRVVHYCGHRITADGAGPLRADDESAAARAIRGELERTPVAYAYGSLASGADILWAEALLERSAELHVVLPFAESEFVAASVADSGADWVARFERCRAAAAHVTFATDDSFLDDDVLYRYGAELAMGLALLRARFLAGEAFQLALWDGEPPRGAAGTAIDVATWRRSGHPVGIVSVVRSTTAAVPVAHAAETASTGRLVRA